MVDRPPSPPHPAGEEGEEASSREAGTVAAATPNSQPPPPPRPPRLVTSWGEDDDDDEEDEEDDDEPAVEAAPTPAPAAWPLASPALVAGRHASPAVAAAAAATPPPHQQHRSKQRHAPPPPALDTAHNPESRFHLLDELGRGSHGAVYAAHDVLAGRLVAVKVVAAVGADAGALAREVEALVGCAHPAVVQHIGAWRSRRGDMWIAMELCDGGSVADAVVAARTARLPAPPPGAPPRPPPPPAAAAAAAAGGGPLSEAEVALVIGAAASAIAHLHARGQVHRDVKCGNLLLCDVAGGEGTRGGSRGDAAAAAAAAAASLVKLADFGVAAPLSRSVSRRASFVGTPHWMAPEVIREEGGYGAAVDVWGLGIAAIEAAEGVPPRWDAHPVRVLFQISADPPPRLGGSGCPGAAAAAAPPPQWSQSFSDFVEACLVKDPARRPTAADVCGHPFIAAVTGAGADAAAAWLARRGPRAGQGAPDAGALAAGRASLAKRAAAAAAARVPARSAAGQRAQARRGGGGGAAGGGDGAWPGGAWPGLAPPAETGGSGAWWSAGVAALPATPPSPTAAAGGSGGSGGVGSADGGGSGRSAGGSGGSGDGGGDYAVALAAAAGGMGGWAAPPPPPPAVAARPPRPAGLVAYEAASPPPAATSTPPSALAAAIAAARSLGVAVDALPPVRAALHAPAAALLDAGGGSGGGGGGSGLPLGWGDGAALREGDTEDASLPFAVAQVRRVARHALQAVREGGGSEAGARSAVAVAEAVARLAVR